MNLPGISFKSVLIIILIIVGLFLSLFLVSKQQIFKSKASIKIWQAFEITDEYGNQITCDDNNICITKSTKINIKLIDLSPLQKEP